MWSALTSTRHGQSFRWSGTRDSRATSPSPNLAALAVLRSSFFGLDALAWARAGAQVTGLDFASAAAAAARDIAQRAGLAERAKFVCADVYEAVDALGHAEFDIVYVSLGALCWLPSVERWAAQVGTLVAPGGRFYLHDGHPLAWALAEDRPEVERSYFEEAEPLANDSGYTYTGPTARCRTSARTSGTTGSVKRSVRSSATGSASSGWLNTIGPCGLTSLGSSRPPRAPGAHLPVGRVCR